MSHLLYPVAAYVQQMTTTPSNLTQGQYPRLGHPDSNGSPSLVAFAVLADLDVVDSISAATGNAKQLKAFIRQLVLCLVENPESAGLRTSSLLRPVQSASSSAVSSSCLLSRVPNPLANGNIYSVLAYLTRSRKGVSLPESRAKTFLEKILSHWR